MPTEPNKSKAAASTATFLHAIEPDAPVLSDVEPGDESVSATFTDGDANGESIDVRQYTLDGGTTWVGTTLDSGTLSVDGLENGQTYSLCIRAANAIGYSTSSTCVSVTPATIPDSPELSDVETGDQTITATFTDGNDNGQPIINRQYSIDMGASWVDVTLSSGTFTISGLVNGQFYPLCVRTENVMGLSPRWCTFAIPSTVPAAPSLSNIEAGDESISATFTDGNTNGEPINARQYTLDGGTTWVGVTPSAGSFTIDNLTNGETYDLCIRAANAKGYSASSDCVDVTPATVPDAPVLSDLRPRENGLRGTVDAGAFDGGSDVTTWQYKLDTGNWVEFADQLTFDGFVRIASGLTNGQEYTICVRSGNEMGDSASSNCETVTPDLAVEPGPPVITEVVADNTSATVTIVEPSDGGADITLFEYSLDDGVTWEEAPDPSLSPLMSFAAGIGSVPQYFSVGVTQTWYIEGLTSGRAYALKVRVTNDAGFTSTSSVYRFTTVGEGLAMTGASLKLDLVLIAAAMVLGGALLRGRVNKFGIRS
jgi:titin